MFNSKNPKKMKGIFSFLIALALCVVLEAPVSAAEKVSFGDEVVLVSDSVDFDFAVAVYESCPASSLILSPPVAYAFCATERKTVYQASALAPNYRRPENKVNLDIALYKKPATRFNPGTHPIRQC